MKRTKARPSVSSTKCATHCASASCVSAVARIGHFLHDEQLHLPVEIERASELQRFDFTGADPFAEISEIGRPTASVALVMTQEQSSRKSMRRRTGAISIGAALSERNCAGFPGALDPVNVVLRALFEKSDDADPRVANAPSQLLQLGFEKFVLASVSPPRRCAPAARSSARMIVSGTKSASRTRTSRPLRKSQRSRSRRKICRSRQPVTPPGSRPAASRVTVKRPFRVRAL